MKTAVITGASSGIGRAIAYQMAEKKYRLILCGRNLPRLQETLAYCQAKTDCISLVFDVSKEDEVKNAFHELPEDWKDIDILINNAGNAHGLDPLCEGKSADWDAMIDSNVKGLLYVSAAVIPGMQKRQSGHIVNISSVAARQTYAKGVVYCATKKAVDTLSEGMRIELTEFGIKVTNIQPGAVETQFSLIRFKNDTEKAAQVYQGYEALHAEDIADAVMYAVEVPDRVSIAEICIYPKAQAEPRTIYRK